MKHEERHIRHAADEEVQLYGVSKKGQFFWAGTRTCSLYAFKRETMWSE